MKNLFKKYGNVRALSGISFSVPSGTIMGLLGRNGAGKSTTLNILTGYLYPDSGDVLIGGVNIKKDPLEAKSRIGYLPESAPLYAELTIEEYLRFILRLRGVRKDMHAAKISQVLEMMDLSHVQKKIIGTLSKGFRQRVGIAQAFCNEAKVVILDEPTIGLDPQQIVAVRRTIRNMKEEYTIILSSHILSEIADICDQVVIIDAGNVLEQGSVSDVVSRHSGGNGLNLTLMGGIERFENSIRRIPGVKSIEVKPRKEQGDVWDLVIGSEGDIRTEVFNCAVDSNVTLLNMGNRSVSLEDIFIQLTSGENTTVKE